MIKTSSVPPLFCAQLGCGPCASSASMQAVLDQLRGDVLHRSHGGLSSLVGGDGIGLGFVPVAVTHAGGGKW
jgi:hypothetical protein